MLVFWQDPPLKAGYLLIEKVIVDTGLAADISVLSDEGEPLSKLQMMRFSDVEVMQKSTYDTESLAPFLKILRSVNHVVLISGDEEVRKEYALKLRPTSCTFVQVTSSRE